LVAHALLDKRRMKTMLVCLPLALALAPACGGSNKEAEDATSQKAEDNAQRAEDKADQAEQKAQDSADKASEKADDAADKADKAADENK
jgi:hypothetical protein